MQLRSCHDSGAMQLRLSELLQSSVGQQGSCFGTAAVASNFVKQPVAAATAAAAQQGIRGLPKAVAESCGTVSSTLLA
jgi:hypothetical protein